MVKMNAKLPHFWALSMVGVGVLLIMAGLFSMNWRVENIGTGGKEWGSWLQGIGTWKTRHYGLFQVYGTIRQTWTTLSRITCDLRDVALVSQGIAAIGNGFDCSSSEACMVGYTAHLAVRCTEYQRIYTVSLVTMLFSFLGMVMILGGLLCGCQCKTQEYGLCVAGTSTFGAVLLLLINVAYAGTTDSAFKEIMKTAWYPYPVLGWSYYCHLFGSAFALIGSLCFMWLTYSEVMKYDKVMDRIKRRENRLVDQKVQLAKAQHAQQQAQLQGAMMQQQAAMQQQAMMQQQGMMMGQPQTTTMTAVTYQQVGGMQPQNAQYSQAGAPAATAIGVSHVDITMQGGAYPPQGAAMGQYQMPAAPTG